MKMARLIEKVTSLAEVRESSSSGSKSVHARVDLTAGQILSKFAAKQILARPNYLTVQIAQSQHIMLAPEWLQYINHSCQTNVFFDTCKQEVILLEAIEAGEEITFFYPSTEWSMSQGFDCLCQSKNCLGKIQGAQFLSPEILARYRLSDYIQGQIASIPAD